MKKTDYMGLFSSEGGKLSNDFPLEDLHFSGFNRTFPLSDS